MFWCFYLGFVWSLASYSTHMFRKSKPLLQSSRVPTAGQPRGRAAQGLMASGGGGEGHFLPLFREYLPAPLRYGAGFHILRRTLQAFFALVTARLIYDFLSTEESQEMAARQYVFVRDEQGRVRNMEDAQSAAAIEEARIRRDLFKRGEL